MKKYTEKKINSNGITLVALVITVIVILILVSVSVNMIAEGGIIQKANTAKQKTEISAEQEQIQLALMENMMSNKDKYDLIEKYTNQKIINKTTEVVLKGEIIELENKRKYLITETEAKYIEGIENAVLLKVKWDYSIEPDKNKLPGQEKYTRDEIEKVYIVNNKNIPQNAEYSWDISEKQDGSVKSWIMDEDKDRTI